MRTLAQCGSWDCCGYVEQGPVFPDASQLDLPGQLNIPGGFLSTGATYVADPSGSTALYQESDVNPNPTGGWLADVQSLANLAIGSFKAFEKGSPSAATPTAKPPAQTPVGKPSGIGVTSKGIDINLPFSTGTLVLVGVGVVVLLMIAK